MDAVRLRYGQAQVQLYLQGAHVTEYCPKNEENVLWLSDSANFLPGKAIRGGIPLCWPWFGASPDADKPQHGFARYSKFEIVDQQIKDNYVAVVLSLDTKSLGDRHEYDGLDFELEVRLSDSLWMEMRTTNQSNNIYKINDCFHNYFSIPDIGQVRIPQLENLIYLDKVQGFKQCEQRVSFSVGQEVDRVYRGVGETVRVLASNESQIDIQTWGLENLVVWNPWSEKAEQMSDFDDLGYQQMICVEPANATYGSIVIPPSATHRSGQQIRLLRP